MEYRTKLPITSTRRGSRSNRNYQLSDKHTISNFKFTISIQFLIQEFVNLFEIRKSKLEIKDGGALVL